MGAAYGARAARVDSREHLRAALKDAAGHEGVSLVIVSLDRERNVAHHREVQAAVAAALEAPR